MPDVTDPAGEPAAVAALQARLDDMAPLSEDGTTRYARVAGDYLAQLAADAIAALRAADHRPDVALDVELREAAERVIDAWDHFESKYDLTTSLAELRAALAKEPSDG